MTRAIPRTDQPRNAREYMHRAFYRVNSGYYSLPPVFTTQGPGYASWSMEYPNGPDGWTRDLMEREESE